MWWGLPGRAYPSVRFLFGIVVLAAVPLVAPSASAQVEAICIDRFLSGQQNPSPERTSTLAEIEDIQTIIRGVLDKVALTRTIGVVPCSNLKVNVRAIPLQDHSKVPDGEYIVYDPTWLRQVAGNNRWQVIALFGHELGHFLNSDFSTFTTRTPKEQEQGADRFAGCAIAVSGGDWNAVEDLFSRLRPERSDEYPDRLASMEAVQGGFEACGGAARPQDDPCKDMRDRDAQECMAKRFWILADKNKVAEAWELTAVDFRSKFSLPYFSQQILQTNVSRGEVRERICSASSQILTGQNGKPVASVPCKTVAAGGQYADDMMLEGQADGSWLVLFFSSLRTELIQ